MRDSGRWVLAMMALFSIGLAVSSAAAQKGGKYNNEFIDDGTLEDSPLDLDFNVTELRQRNNKYSRRIIDHYLANDYDAVVKDLKGRYKGSKPLANDFKIIGFIFLTQVQHWAFTLKEQSTGVEYVMEVMPNSEGQGTVIALHTRKYGVKSAAYKRSWFGSSPAAGKKHKLWIKAY